jgi:hypothetical protein
MIRTKTDRLVEKQHAINDTPLYATLGSFSQTEKFL